MQNIANTKIKLDNFFYVWNIKKIYFETLFS